MTDNDVWLIIWTFLVYAVGLSCGVLYTIRLMNGWG